MMLKAPALLPIILSLLLSMPVTCRTLNQHTVCILEIQRSAKNYWQYRASISIDGIKKPSAFYNCRDRHVIQKDGTPIKFESDGIGNFVCRLYKPPALPQSAASF